MSWLVYWCGFLMIKLKLDEDLIASYKTSCTFSISIKPIEPKYLSVVPKRDQKDFIDNGVIS